MDFNKCSIIGCNHKKCEINYQGIGSICKSCWKDFIEYMYSKYPKSLVDINMIPEKIIWKDLEFFISNNVKKN